MLTQTTQENKSSDAVRDDSPAPLGSTYQQRFPDQQNDDRILRFALQAAARELAPTHRIGTCLRAVIPGKDSVDVWLSEKSRKAYYQNLMCCGSVWVCPVCAAKISERRRKRLEAAFNVTDKIPVIEDGGSVRFLIAPRYYLSMVTFTISHKANEPAVEVVNRIKAAYEKMWSGRYAEAFRKRYRVIGTIRALEITHGIHGWHPHYHLLLIRDSANTRSTIFYMDLALTERWSEKCGLVGAYAEILRGVKLSAGDNKASEYLTKIGQQVNESIRRWSLSAEMTKYVAKHGRQDSRTLWDLLIAYINGDVKAGKLWIEGKEAMKGSDHLRASNGLWKTLGVPDLDAKDETLAQEPQSASDRLMASLTLSEWKVVIRENARGSLLQQAESGNDLHAYVSGLGKVSP